MTLDEFIKLFNRRKIMVHVNNQLEKAEALKLVRTYVFTKTGYDVPFDPDYQYIGVTRGRDNICCWCNPDTVNARSVEYGEFCAIVYGQEETVDEKSIISLL